MAAVAGTEHMRNPVLIELTRGALIESGMPARSPWRGRTGRLWRPSVMWPRPPFPARRSSRCRRSHSSRRAPPTASASARRRSRCAAPLHSGTPAHTALVRSMLRAPACHPTHWPAACTSRLDTGDGARDDQAGRCAGAAASQLLGQACRHAGDRGAQGRACRRLLASRSSRAGAHRARAGGAGRLQALPRRVRHRRVLGAQLGDAAERPGASLCPPRDA